MSPQTSGIDPALSPIPGADSGLGTHSDPARPGARAAAPHARQTRPGARADSTVESADRTGQLAVSEVTVRLGDRTVLNRVSLSANAADRIGLIGENGTGKSTLLRVFAGELTPDAGQIRRVAAGPTASSRIGYLAQEPDFDDDATVGGVLAAAQRDLLEIAERQRHLEAELSSAAPERLPALLASYGDLQDEYTRRGGWDAPARAGRILAMLGLATVAPQRPAITLSGGERSRLALAALLVSQPAALLLDEPTNHLDDAAADWLAGWLRRFPGPTLIASHDRTFLRAAVTAIVDLDGPRGSAVSYGGGYDAYLAEQTVQRRRWELDHRAWRESVAQARYRLEHSDRATGHARPPRDNDKTQYNFLRERVHAAISRAARSAQERLDQLLRNPVPEPPEPLRFAADPAEPADERLLTLDRVRVAGRLDQPVTLSLRAGDRVTVTGANGAGKSTLLRVLAGKLAPSHGTRQVADPLRLGYLPQDTTVTRPELTLAEAFAVGYPTAEEAARDRLLGFGLFRPADLEVPVGRASVGQRRRLALAGLLASRPQVLLLDEPTNHLSPLLVEQLQAAIAEFPGPVVLVTHDRQLRTQVDARPLHLTAAT